MLSTSATGRTAAGLVAAGAAGVQALVFAAPPAGADHAYNCSSTAACFWSSTQKLSAHQSSTDWSFILGHGNGLRTVSAYNHRSRRVCAYEQVNYGNLEISAHPGEYKSGFGTRTIRSNKFVDGTCS